MTSNSSEFTKAGKDYLSGEDLLRVLSGIERLGSLQQGKDQNESRSLINPWDSPLL